MNQSMLLRLLGPTIVETHIIYMHCNYLNDAIQIVEVQLELEFESQIQ